MSLWRNFSRLATIGCSSSSTTTTASRVGLFTLANRFSTTHLAQIPLAFVVSCSNFHHWNAGLGGQQQKQSILRQHNLVSLQFRRNFSEKNQQQQQPPCKKSSDGEDQSATSSAPAPLEEEKLGLFARFKKMYKEYWYVLVPVHCVTSVFWFGGFYYASTSGVDVIAILESMGVSEKLINPVRDSSLGHIAIAYLLYKIATPARYTVTLGGTTVSIKYLVQWGYIKPIPTKTQLMQMYQDKKADVKERIAEKKQDLQDRKKSMMDGLKEQHQQQKQKTSASSPPGVPDEK